MKKILLGVSGGIAAYKIPELVRFFAKDGCSVKTILTENALKFCTKDSIAALSGESVYTGIFEPAFLDEGHTELAKWPDVFVVAPATANTIAKLVLGVADNLLTTTYLASRAPKLIVPAMNTEMYESDPTQKNIEILKLRGAFVLPPAVGELACGTYGAGRMPDPWDIVEAAHRAMGPRPLEGKRVVVSAGASVEPIDGVRLISNRSSGKMGAAMALSAYRRGADVTLILGQAKVCPLPPVHIERADSIQSFQKAYDRYATRADYFVGTAAIGDFVPAKAAKGKMKRESGDRPVSIEFKASPDLIAEVAGKKSKNQKVIGFALETELDERAAKTKLREKRLDGIFLNRIEAMGSDTNGGVAISANGKRHAIKTMPKLALAEKLWDWIGELD